MSEEEKKAIEWLKKADWFSARKYAPSILQLIDKQQKELEELKKENFDTVYIQAIENYKTKIRAKIKEIENEHTGNTRNVLSVLQELLEE